MERAEIRKLWTEYTTYWLQTASIQRVRASGKPIRTPKLTSERYQLFSDLYDWCSEKDLDPSLWLFALFRSRRWTYAVPLERGSLLSERFLSNGKYQKMLDRGTLDGYRLSRQGTKSALDPNVDIIHGAEQKKRVYALYGQVDLCMMNAAAETFGFHPCSQWCNRCRLRAECESRIQNMVPFDIVALRRGELTVEEARATARG